MILPIPQKAQMTDKTVTKRQITVAMGDGDARKGAEAFCLFCEDAAMADGGAFVRFCHDDTLDPIPEIYKLTVAADGVTVGFRDVRGAINGAASAALLLKKDEWTEGEIIDYPDCSFRSFMIDMARGLPDLDRVKQMIRYMALGKYNRLHLHLTDSKGPCYISEVLPEYYLDDDWKRCTKADLREIVDLCSRFAIEVIPEIELITHANTFCKIYPQFVCDAPDADNWEVCPGSEELWGHLDLLLGEIVSIFPESEYIHVGADELEFADLQGPGRRICHWDVCTRCAELRRREGLNGRQDQIYYVINRLHDMVRQHGKKMIMWNDQIDISGDVPISRDILIQFWRVAAPGRGPYEGCSMAKFIEKGFKVINSYYPYTYLEFETYLSEAKLQAWSPVSAPELPQEYLHNVVGGEMCAWEFGNTAEYPCFGYVTPPGLALFADKLWHFGHRDYNAAYKQALSEFVFGYACENDVFACTGTMLPSRRADQPTNAPLETLSVQLLDHCIAELNQKKRGFYSAVSDAYAGLLKQIRELL